MIEITGRRSHIPFPDISWNELTASGRKVLNTPHGVVIDTKDRLWIIDHGNWIAKPQPPKLVAFDIHSRKLTHRHDFECSMAPDGQVLQDLAIDTDRGFVYVADCGADRPSSSSTSSATRRAASGVTRRWPPKTSTWW
ncbi:L-dopachrome tautomerase-related protein [Variovorax sp. JS1663]|uniref:L-dopachrome tautomerase-related protein n=1 Tax=Variovorax sp. JS1663 TaxID=1851577 RepID=UPI00192CFFE4|nr:L-dopachrome tautomerase-related protein [Variovorax sp. JS1663]